MGGYAWVTLATNDAYSLGALVLAHSLRRVGTTHDLVCMVTPGVTPAMREKLASIFSLVQEVNVLDSKDEANLALLARPELGITFTKLHCWRLTQYEKCVFIDADALVVRNCDELFEREELSAAPDVGWPDCFNSGVFVFRPSQQTFASITAFAAAKGSFDGGDQGILNMYFSDWAMKDISKHLPFIYNMCSTATYSYLPAFKQFGEDVRIIHFIGITKPWLQYFDTLTGIVQPPEGSGHLQPLLQFWWNIFCENVHSQLSASMVRSTVSIWNISSSHLPPVPTRAVCHKPNDSSYNDTNRQAPDFSEFRDPWEGYRPQDDSFLINRQDTSNNNYEESHYTTDRFQASGYAYEKEHNVARETGCDVLYLGRDQQSRYDERHISFAPLQTYNQQQHATPYVTNERNRHAIPHSEENYNQRHTEYHYQHREHYNVQYQQHDEQEHRIEHYHEQRHNREQNQQNERKYYDEQKQNNEQRYYEEQRQFSRQNQQPERSQQDDHYLHVHVPHQPICVHYSNGQSHSMGVREDDTGNSNQASCQNEKYDGTFYNNKFYVRQSVYPSSNQHMEDSSGIIQAESRNAEFTPIPFLPPLAPCTDFHNVDTLLHSRSDTKIMEHPNKTNAGIAGALAQLTLGEARSAEQMAFEDQMRKQSWEQGQIDYMGRDSFENIWKKIMETLSQTPQQQPTPPKEDIPKVEERTATDDKPAEQIAVSADVAPAVEADKDKDPTQGQLLACKIPEEKSSAQIMIARESGDGAVIVAQSSEQMKAATSPSEKTSVVEAVATKASGELPQPSPATQEDVCAKPLSPDVSCEAITGVPAPQPLPMEPPSAAQTSVEQQCKLATPITKTPSQDKSESTRSEEPLASLPTEQAVYVPQKPIAPVTQTSDVSLIEGKTLSQLPATDKPQMPDVPVAPDVTQSAFAPISIDSLGSIAVPIGVPPGESTLGKLVQESTKLVTESKVDVMQPLAIDPGEQRAEMLLATSEVSTVSPVPIQVAESVLQTEPKEAVSGAAVAASDQAIATTITAVHETAAVAPAEPETRAVQINGSACDAEKPIGDIATVAAAVHGPSQEPVAAVDLTKEPASDSTTTKDAALGIPPLSEEKIVSSSSATSPETLSEKTEKLAKPAEQIAETEKKEFVAQIAKTESTETKPPEQAAKTEAAEALKPTEQIAKAETIEGKPAGQIAKAETIAKPETIEAPAKIEAAVKPTESTEPAPKKEAIIEAKIAAAKSAGDIPKSPIAEEKPPSESIEAKVLDIPSTPTVIEATPPTSPSVESAQEVQEGQEKTAKKSLKKSDSADGTDGEGTTDKKTGKKSVKKVTKKTKSSKPEETVGTAATETVAVTAATTTPPTTPPIAGTGADSSQGKTKKTVKVTKKTGAKTGLETDTAIPETPPPPTPTSTTATTVTGSAPDVPVPPKRKTKTPTSGKGTTGKKSETEE